MYIYTSLTPVHEPTDPNGLLSVGRSAPDIYLPYRQLQQHHRARHTRGRRQRARLNRHRRRGAIRRVRRQRLRRRRNHEHRDTARDAARHARVHRKRAPAALLRRRRRHQRLQAGGPRRRPCRGRHRRRRRCDRHAGPDGRTPRGLPQVNVHDGGVGVVAPVRARHAEADGRDVGKRAEPVADARRAAHVAARRAVAVRQVDAELQPPAKVIAHVRKHFQQVHKVGQDERLLLAAAGGGGLVARPEAAPAVGEPAGHVVGAEARQVPFEGVVAEDGDGRGVGDGQHNGQRRCELVRLVARVQNRKGRLVRGVAAAATGVGDRYCRRAGQRQQQRRERRAQDRHRGFLKVRERRAEICRG